MHSVRHIGAYRRFALAVVALAAVFFLASGATLIHKHTSGPENPCHFCQMVHLPALAAYAPNLLDEPQILTRYSFTPQATAPSEAFAIHRASRAPPLA